MRKTTKRLLFTLVVFSALVTSCYNDVELNNIEKEILIDHALVTPVGTINVSSEKFLTRMDSAEFIYTNGDGEMGMEINDSFEIEFRNVNLLSYATPANFANSFTSSDITIPAGGNHEFAISQEFMWNFGVNSNVANERIDVAELGLLTINSVLSLNNININPSDVTVKLSFGNRIVNTSTGQAYVPTYNGSAESVNFVPVTIDFSSNNPTPSSSIPVQVTLVVNNSSSSNLVVTNSANFNLAVDIQAIEYEILYGYFKPSNNATKTKEYDITFIDDLVEGTIRIVNPNILLNVGNSVGESLTFDVSNINFSNTSDPSIKAKLFFNGGSDSYNFNLAKPATIGETVYTEESFTTENTNFNNVLENKIFPGKFEITTKVSAAESNPIDYLHKNSKITVNIKTILPFEFNENTSYIVLDTLDNINIEIGENLQLNDDSPLYIDTALIVINVSNGLPLNIKLTPVFYDSLSNQLNFNTDEYYNVNPPTINSQGFAVPPIEEQQIIIKIKHEHINLLETLDHIVYYMYVDTKEANSANIQESDMIEIRAGVYIRFDSILNY
ncbi:MAG: hypothetical protein LBP67_04435 [Bacteroidales bacterium]|nr:hypothetical protein [Bacteroidales bacterium]